MNSFFLFCSCLVLLVSAGCANHIRNIVVKDTQIKRIPEKVDYFITLEDKDEVIQIPEIDIKIEKQLKSKVIHYEITRTKQMFTPYQGWRKLYEIPMGIGLLPCAIVVSLADFATLGLIPNSFTDDLLDYSFTGMNPFLNIENEKRMILEDCKAVKKKIDTRNETLRFPVADIKVQLYYIGSDELLLAVETSADGSAEIYFFHDDLVKSSFPSERELMIRVMDDKNQEVAKVKVLIDRLLAIKLKKAIKLIDKFHAKETPEGLAELIWKLEKLKFHKIALKLEKKSLVRHLNDKTFSSRFKAAMTAAAQRSGAVK